MKKEKERVEDVLQKPEQEQIVSVASDANAAGAEKQISQVCYVGPSLPNGLLTHGQVFTNGIPAPVQEQVDALPHLGTLLVPVDAVGKARRQLKSATGPLAMAARKVMGG